MSSELRSGRWLVSASFDSLWFIAPGFLSLVVVAPVLLGVWEIHDVSPIAWLFLVVFIDVAHVWTTLFRTYLDAEERKRRPWLYWGTPWLVFCGGFLLHSAKPSWFWTFFAYVAVHHFIKQQYGFVSLYRHKAGEKRTWVRRFDQWAIYTGAGVPVLYWHSTLPRNISWFVEGDFIGPIPEGVMFLGWIFYGIIGSGWLVHRVLDIRLQGPQWGRDLTMLATWFTWYVGIVVTDVDFVFTATNVVIHGVPYAALVWHSSRSARCSRESSQRPRFWIFASLCLLLALVEEGLWDLTVWHERADWFGSLPATWGDAPIIDFAVPLLMVPQATHYILDGFIWKMDGTNPGLRTRIFEPIAAR